MNGDDTDMQLSIKVPFFVDWNCSLRVLVNDPIAFRLCYECLLLLNS